MTRTEECVSWVEEPEKKNGLRRNRHHLAVDCHLSGFLGNPAAIDLVYIFGTPAFLGLGRSEIDSPEAV